MKKCLILLVIVLLIGCESAPGLISRDQGMSGGGEGQASEVEPDAPNPSEEAGNYDTVSLSSEQVTRGNLVLVNKDYPIDPVAVPNDILNLYDYPEMTEGYVLLDNRIRLSRYVVEQFKLMIQAADQDGVNHFMISSGYRDNEEQEELYRDKGSDYALPAGHSEHNLGLSLDIGSTQKAIDRSPEGKWLRRHAWEYGFILRYPEDKTAITGIQFEPWHFRYVGLPHSLIMHELDYTLEEYLDFLRQEGVYTTEVKGMPYEIRYIPATGADLRVDVPSG